MKVDKCINEIDNEIQLIDDLLNSHEILIKKLQTSEPDQIKISAIATL